MKNKIILLISIFFLFTNNVYAKETVKFSKCVDGDTFRVYLDEKEYYVRMLAIDTPESVKEKELEYYGKESSTYTCQKLTNAKKIELEYDEHSEKMDKYDRLLAWVFIDGKLLQEELVENGYAKVAYLYDNYKYASILKEKQELASAQNLGVWDMTAKKEFNPNEVTTEEEQPENLEVVLITIIFLIITFIFSIIKRHK